MAKTKAKFSWLVDAAAFLDRIELSVDSRQPRLSNKIVETKNVAVLTKTGFYSRCLAGKWAPTGNPFRILYGKASRFPRVPRCRVELRSEEVPWTGAQANLFMKAVFPDAPELKVTLVELTSDVSTIPFSTFRQTVLHRATCCKLVGDQENGRTQYIGSPTSPLQARIYEKQNGIVRHELVLRRGFLPARKIISLNDLAKLSSLETWRWLSLRKYSRDRIVAAIGESLNTSWGRVVSRWEDDQRGSLQTLGEFLRAGKIDPDEVLYYSRDQLQLRRMLRRLVW